MIAASARLSSVAGWPKNFRLAESMKPFLTIVWSTTLERERAASTSAVGD
jgi:hypothetical protein